MVWLPVVMNWTRAWFNLVVVDEAQDMNLSQLTMAVKACKHGGRICVVGDDRQAIYGFRGAATDGMQMMRQKLSAKQLGLTTTYRCPRLVVELAQEIVPDYVSAPSAPRGMVDWCSDVQARVQIGDSILSRINAPLAPICLSLLRNGIPARIEGRDIGKQLSAIVKKLKARSVPECLSKLRAWGNRQIVRLKAAGTEDRISGITDQVETIVAIAEGASNISEITQRLESLFADTENGARPAVVLSSVHKAKGLEWNHVFILRETFRHKSSEGEEANIYYVAITRAKQHLTFVSSKEVAS
jgi:superfamily I DNA/RNA helicase